MGKNYGINEGYTITERYVGAELGYALGQRDTDIAGFVTWAFRPDTPKNFFWGHYFNDKESALKDYTDRIDEECALFVKRTGKQPRHPKLCLSVEPSSGDLICIKRGLTGFYASEWNRPGEREHNQNTADVMNRRWGVSAEQEQAMLAGSIFGWDVPAAEPRSYGSDGTPTKPRHRKKHVHER